MQLFLLNKIKNANYFQQSVIAGEAKTRNLQMIFRGLRVKPAMTGGVIRYYSQQTSTKKLYKGCNKAYSLNKYAANPSSNNSFPSGQSL